MKKLTIHKIGVLSAAKVAGVLGVVIGLLVGMIYAAVFMVMGASMMGGGAEEGAGLLAVGAGAVCVVPILYGVLSFVMGAVYAFVFNLAVGVIGGLELEVEEGDAVRSA